MSVARFWRKQANRYNLIGTKCETCGTYFFPPRTFCPKCRRDGKIVDYKFKGHGKIVTFSVVRNASAAYDLQTPFVVAIIELDEGTRLTGQVICSDINEVYIGMRVKATFRRITAEGDSGIIVYGTKFIRE